MRTNTTLTALFQLLLVAMLLGVMTLPATAQGPMPCEICALVAKLQAQQAAGVNVGYATGQTSTARAGLEWWEYQTHYAEVAIGASRLPANWLYVAGYNVAWWQLAPSFLGVTMSAYNYQQYLRQRYAPYGYDAMGHIRN